MGIIRPTLQGYWSNYVWYPWPPWIKLMRHSSCHHYYLQEAHCPYGFLMAQGLLESCYTFCLSQYSPTLISSLFYFKNTKIYLLEGNWGTSMIQRGATDGSSWGLREKLLTEMLWNRHCHWTNPSHFSLPDCCWQRGSPEVSSLTSMPTAPPVHPCPFITVSFLFRSWW